MNNIFKYLFFLLLKDPLSVLVLIEISIFDSFSETFSSYLCKINEIKNIPKKKKILILYVLKNKKAFSLIIFLYKKIPIKNLVILHLLVLKIKAF